jgi:hypothetical protein
MECQLDQARTKSSLSPSQSRLVELLQQLNFGRVEGLRIRAGEPIFEPAPRIIQKLKIGSENGPRVEGALPDFWLKQQVIEMFETIARVGDGEILSIDVKYGLPFALEIERPLPSGPGVIHG